MCADVEVAGSGSGTIHIRVSLADLCLEAALETVKAEVRSELRGAQQLMSTLPQQLTAVQEQQTTLQE